MGDFFQTIVDCDASESEAAMLSQRVCHWLLDQQIMGKHKMDNILSETELGYPPGQAYHLATTGQDSHFLSLLTNGLAVITTRSLFHPGQGGGDAVCSTCGTRFEVGTKSWDYAVDEWYSNRGPGILPCPHCGADKPIDHW